jgi:hypothetical protein
MATESRKLIFMTDQGSTRATAKRTRRGPFDLRLVSLVRDAAVFAAAGLEAGVEVVGWAPTGRVGCVREVIAPRESVASPGAEADAEP